MDDEITLPPSDFVANDVKPSVATSSNRAFFKRHTHGRGRGGNHSHSSRGKPHHRGGHNSRGRGNHH